MTSPSKYIEQAKALAGSKSAMDSASGDLAGHVATFRARLEADGAEAVGTVAYARTVVDLARVEGISLTSSSGDDGPTKAELQAQAEALGLPKSGSKADLAKRIAEAKAEPPAED